MQIETIDQLAARSNFFWPWLEPIWNPPSRVHWDRNVIAIFWDCPSSVGLIPTDIILAAAQHGYAVLIGGPRQQVSQELAMLQCLDASRPNYWKDYQQSIRSLERKCKRKRDSDVEKTTWLPTSYAHKAQMLLHSPACKRISNEYAVASSRNPTKEMKAERDTVRKELSRIWSRDHSATARINRSTSFEAVQLTTLQQKNIQ